MEDLLPRETLPNVVINENTKDLESAENFQKFIFDLFDRNGILNDLRAYLRGHIVNVLKSAQTGEPPTCQKHFTQRLHLTFQALNMLVAEYLLRLEFSYSYSVFISEIPLANMVFEFAETIMKNDNHDNTNLKFKDNDVWSILNYLGVKCDSEHASRIFDSYNTEENCPLLLCILKEMPMYKKSVCTEQINSSNDNIVLSSKSSESLNEKTARSSYKNLSSQNKCGHYVHCKTCQDKIITIKEKYIKRKKKLKKSENYMNYKTENVELFLKNISVVERNLIDEMFEQLKNVYEEEVEMVKEDQESKVKRCLANHALQLQQKHDEMEVSLKSREEALERNVQQKKKFLWGVARALRDQHDNMTRAMHDVKLETNRLTDKEESLKTQLAKAEKVLRQRGEEMRIQISNELIILETHLDCMKKERDSINKERYELEQLKEYNNNNKDLKIINKDTEELRSHYELLKDELSILKKYMDSMKLEPKCVIERSTMTDSNDSMLKLNVLNNSQEYMRCDESLLRNNQLVNDLKKQKNVNFSQSNLDEIYRERSRERSRSSASSEAGDSPHHRELLLQLREENETLKTFAQQQREHIDVLCSEQARLQAELIAERYRTQASTRPHTAPAPAPPLIQQHEYLLQSGIGSSNAVNHSCRKGAGEELGFFTNAQPRIYLPGDILPFIGVLRDKNTDNRRHLINQWRMLRRRVSPVRCINKPRTSSPRRRVVTERPVSTGVSIDTKAQEQDDTEVKQISEDILQESVHRERYEVGSKSNAINLGLNKHKEKNSKSYVREAKEKLRNKENVKAHHFKVTSREKSPNSVVREAKLRLRKLEIEAEAVEKSYMDFRKRQTALNNQRQSFTNQETIGLKNVPDLDIQKSESNFQKLNVPQKANVSSIYKEANESMRTDFDKYLRVYQTTSKLKEDHFRNRNSSIGKVRPIPETYSNIDESIKISDYLETPLNEFRKLYQSGKSRSPKRVKSPKRGCTSNSGTNKNNIKTQIQDKKAELEILSDNINKLYNLPNDSLKFKIVEASALKVDTSKSDKFYEENNTVDMQNLDQQDAINFDKFEENVPTNFDNIEKNETGTVYTIENNSINIDDNEDKNSANFGDIKETDSINIHDKIEENLLRVELESVSVVNGIKITESKTQDLLLIVESVANSEAKSSNEGITSTQMTVIISPRQNNKSNLNNDTKDEVLEAIFRAEENTSSVQMQFESSKDILDLISIEEKGDNYQDDFTADVDNYNISDYENNSPISLPKTSEDDNFWDS